MTEPFRGDRQAELAAVRRRPGELAATRSNSRVAGKSGRCHGFSKRFVFGLLPLLGCLVLMGGTVSADDALFINPQGLVGIGTPNPGEKLQVSKGKIQLDGNQQLKFADGDVSNNLKLQLWSGFGLGINNFTLFYAADSIHSWRDKNGTNERMVLTTNPDGGLAVKGTGKSSFAGAVDIGKNLAVMGTGNSSFAGNVGIGKPDPGEKLQVSAGKIQLDGDQQIKFTDTNTSNNLKLQLWSGYGLGINGSTLFYAANGRHSWRDNNGTNERMVLTTAPDGGLTVTGTGVSTFAGSVIVGGDIFVHGRLKYYWGPDGKWKQVENRYGNWAGSYDTGGPSDLRLKSQVESLPTALDKVLHLRGVSYQWNDEALKYFTRDIENNLSAGPEATAADNQNLWKAERDKRYRELGTNQVGVVAQDVEAVLPEAVTTDEAGYKSVRYHYLIPLLIEALKEQDKTVKEQAQMVAQQQQEIARLVASNLAVEQKLAELAAVKEQMARLEAAVQRVAATQAFGTIDAVAQLSETKTR